MGELVWFRPREGRSSKTQPTGSAGAEIVFFTGVRYERMKEPEPVLQGTLPDPNPAEGLGRPSRGRKRRRG
jgi:hypothetical protein